MAENGVVEFQLVIKNSTYWAPVAGEVQLSAVVNAAFPVTVLQRVQLFWVPLGDVKIW